MTSSVGAHTGTSFEQQRALLLNDVVANMENVLQKINRLNRNLEGIIAVSIVHAANYAWSDQT